LLDAASLTHSYPYEEINDYLRLHPDREPALRATLNYFDGVNFASRITCPMLVYIGLQDDVCPPETGYAVYRAMSCPKDLHATPRCAHDAGAYWEMAKVTAFLAEHLRPTAVGSANSTPTRSAVQGASPNGAVEPAAPASTPAPAARRPAD